MYLDSDRFRFKVIYSNNHIFGTCRCVCVLMTVINTKTIKHNKQCGLDWLENYKMHMNKQIKYYNFYFCKKLHFEKQIM